MKMSLTKRECSYLKILLNSRIEKLESLPLDELTPLEKNSAIQTPKKIIEKLNHSKKQLTPLDIVNKRKRKEKIQKNTTKIIG